MRDAYGFQSPLEKAAFYAGAKHLVMLELKTLMQDCETALDAMEKKKSITSYNRHRSNVRKNLARMAHAVGMFGKFARERGFIETHNAMYRDDHLVMSNYYNRIQTRFEQIKLKCE